MLSLVLGWVGGWGILSTQMFQLFLPVMAAGWRYSPKVKEALCPEQLV